MLNNITKNIIALDKNIKSMVGDNGVYININDIIYNYIYLEIHNTKCGINEHNVLNEISVPPDYVKIIITSDITQLSDGTIVNYILDKLKERFKNIDISYSKRSLSKNLLYDAISEYIFAELNRVFLSKNNIDDIYYEDILQMTKFAIESKEYLYKAIQSLLEPNIQSIFKFSTKSISDKELDFTIHTLMGESGYIHNNSLSYYTYSKGKLRRRFSTNKESFIIGMIRHAIYDLFGDE